MEWTCSSDAGEKYIQNFDGVTFCSVSLGDVEECGRILDK